MRNFLRLCSIGLLTFASIAAFAQNAKSGVGTWVEDSPNPATIHIYKDTPQMLSWKVEYRDDSGKPVTTSWSGPEDGTMHPVKSSDPKDKMMQSAKMENGKLHRHGESPDGSSFDAYSFRSEDGNTITDEITTRDKSGKEKKETAVFHRSNGSHAAPKHAAKKS